MPLCGDGKLLVKCEIVEEQFAAGMKESANYEKRKPRGSPVAPMSKSS